MKPQLIITNLLAFYVVTQQFEHWFIALVLAMMMSTFVAITVLKIAHHKSYNELKRTMEPEEFHKSLRFIYCIHLLVYTYAILP